jgi:hypothetical protein
MTNSGTDATCQKAPTRCRFGPSPAPLGESDNRIRASLRLRLLRDRASRAGEASEERFLTLAQHPWVAPEHRLASAVRKPAAEFLRVIALASRRHSSTETSGAKRRPSIAGPRATCIDHEHRLETNRRLVHISHLGRADIVSDVGDTFHRCPSSNRLLLPGDHAASDLAQTPCGFRRLD